METNHLRWSWSRNPYALYSRMRSEIASWERQKPVGEVECWKEGSFPDDKIERRWNESVYLVTWELLIETERETKWEIGRKTVKTNFERESSLESNGIGVIKDGISQKSQITARIVGSKVIKNGRVTDQHFQSTCPIHVFHSCYDKWEKSRGKEASKIKRKKKVINAIKHISNSQARISFSPPSN